MSWKVEVIADTSGKWSSNSVRFETEEQARTYGADLARRWTLVTDWHVAESADAVNRPLINGPQEVTQS